MSKLKKVFLRRVIINGNLYIAIRFKYDIELISVCKSLRGAYWNSKMRVWIISDQSEVVKRITWAFAGIAEVSIDESVVQPSKVTDKTRQKARQISTPIPLC